MYLVLNLLIRNQFINNKKQQPKYLRTRNYIYIQFLEGSCLPIQTLYPPKKIIPFWGDIT